MAKWVVTIVEDNDDDQTRYLDVYVKDTFKEADDIVMSYLERLMFNDTKVRVWELQDGYDAAYEMRIDLIAFKSWVILSKMRRDSTGIATNIKW